MSIIRWTPRRNGNEVTSLRSELDRLFEGFYTPGSFSRDLSSLSPAVDVEETPDAIVTELRLPEGMPDSVRTRVVALFAG